MNYGIITVDTEGHDGKDPIDHLIWGKLSDDLYAGIDMIMDISESYDTKALFFVDLAEAWDHGKEKIKTVVEHIRKRGHGVGVHIHPDHMADRSRLFLWEYSKEEQYEIIKKCTALYREITGEAPVFFRAGKYSANYDTLDIIDELGYKYDFSEFKGQKWCGIDPPLTADRPCRYKNLIEFPVTVFKAAETLVFERYDKLDIEMVSSQFNNVIDKLSEKDDYVLSLFLHSFSLIKWRRDPDRPRLWKKNIRKYNNALLRIKNNRNIDLICPEKLDELVASGKLDISETGNPEPYVKIKNWIMIYYFLLTTSLRIAEHNKKARWFIILNLLIAAVLMIIVIRGSSA